MPDRPDDRPDEKLIFDNFLLRAKRVRDPFAEPDSSLLPLTLQGQEWLNSSYKFALLELKVERSFYW